MPILESVYNLLGGGTSRDGNKSHQEKVNSIKYRLKINHYPAPSDQCDVAGLLSPPLWSLAGAPILGKAPPRLLSQA